MRLNDHAVSELMGYTVLVAVVSIAAIGLLAGSMSSLSSTEKRMELAGSASSLRSFAGMVSSRMETNNSFSAACEMGVPSGYELALMDKHDDFRSLSIYSGSVELAFLPFGSVASRSPFRSAAFEGGAVISNDTGVATVEKTPAVHVLDLGSGRKALYVSITSISCNSSVTRGGPAILYVKCSSVEPMAWHVPDGTTITLRVRSGGLSAWEEWLERCGFTVTYEGGEVKATSREVTDIYVVYAEAGVEMGGR
jgi:hypothetical protein